MTIMITIHDMLPQKVVHYLYRLCCFSLYSLICRHSLCHKIYCHAVLMKKYNFVDFVQIQVIKFAVNLSVFCYTFMLSMHRHGNNCSVLPISHLGFDSKLFGIALNNNILLRYISQSINYLYTFNCPIHQASSRCASFSVKLRKYF